MLAVEISQPLDPVAIIRVHWRLERVDGTQRVRLHRGLHARARSRQPQDHRDRSRRASIRSSRADAVSLGGMGVRRLDRDEARQLAVRAQLLDANRPTDLVDLVDRLTLLQIDPTAAIAPNADLVAWSRLGASYQPAQLTRALEQDRTLFELRAFIRPTTAVALHVPEETHYTAQPTGSGMGRGERRLSARHPRPPPRRRAAALPRRAGHQSGAVELDRLDEQPQRHPDAGAALRAEERSRSPDGSDGSGSGTSPTASTRTSSPSPQTRPSAAGRSGASDHSASRVPR